MDLSLLRRRRGEGACCFDRNRGVLVAETQVRVTNVESKLNSDLLAEKLQVS